MSTQDRGNAGRQAARATSGRRPALPGLLAALVVLPLWLTAAEVGASPQRAFARRDVIHAPQVDFTRLADVDGDGDLDFLAVEPDGENLDWWENESVGATFTEHVITRSSNGVQVVTPGDIDGDGDVDLVTLAPDRNRLGLWRNDGSGRFTEDLAFSPVALQVTHIEATDVNADGWDDLLVLKGQANRIEWWANAATADELAYEVHAVTSRAAVTGRVVRLEAGDVDGDGWVDFATANTDAGRINWWRHSVDGSGHAFERQHPTGYRAESAVDVSLADIDTDGDLDLLVSRSTAPYRVNAWLQTADGFTRDTQPLAQAPANKPWHALDTGDMNADGAVDFAVSELDGRLCWYENPAAAPTPTPSLPSTATPTPTVTSGSSATPTTTPMATDAATATGTAIATRVASTTPPAASATPSPTATAATPSAAEAVNFLPRLER